MEENGRQYVQEECKINERRKQWWHVVFLMRFEEVVGKSSYF